MKTRISVRFKKLLPCNNVTRMDSPNHCDLDLREEYANAFRTESYDEFWARVLAISSGGDASAASCKAMRSTTADRLPSYRLFSEHLLDPDQSTVSKILTLVQNRPGNHLSLLRDYFSKTADASLLCGLLLKVVDRTRVRYRKLKTTLTSLDTAHSSSMTNLPFVLTRLSEFSNSVNPFVPSALAPCRFRVVQADCSDLLIRLESSRDKAQAKLRLISRLKRFSAVFLVALTTSLTVTVAFHALAVLLAAPGLIVAASHKLASSKRLARLSAQLDAAAKGTFILNRDLDTISRLVTRVKDELEHKRAMIKFWVEKRDNRLQAGEEVAARLKKHDSSFREQLDELEEHLYLCFMTINRARNLVIKEIFGAGQPTRISAV